MNASPSVESRRLLRGRRFGVLSTQSKRIAGYPFGSVVPYMVDHDATLVILLSRLAEHTRNIEADPRVSLTVFEEGADVQARSRVTVVGDCTKIPLGDPVRDRYLRIHPRAADHLRLDFDFHRIEPVAARYIGGFGAVQWVNGDLVVRAEAISRAEHPLIDRIGRELAAELRAGCGAILGTPPVNVATAALDCDGLDVRADDHLLRIDVPSPLFDPDALFESISTTLRDVTK